MNRLLSARCLMQLNFASQECIQRQLFNSISFPVRRIVMKSVLPVLPPSFEGIELPENRKLTVMQRIPYYYMSQKAPRLRKLHNDIRGPERVQNTLLHKQYGIIALCGGYLEFGHFEMIRNGMNKYMDTRKMFAVWRVDPPWKPVVKKGVGKRMGGGKPNAHHFATPVKAGRIVIELGGKFEFEEAYTFLNRIAKKLPFDAIAINQKMFDELEEEAKDLERRNINPLTFEYVVDHDIQGCNLWTSPNDKLYHGKYI